MDSTNTRLEVDRSELPRRPACLPPWYLPAKPHASGEFDGAAAGPPDVRSARRENWPTLWRCPVALASSSLLAERLYVPPQAVGRAAGLDDIRHLGHHLVFRLLRFSPWRTTGYAAPSHPPTSPAPPSRRSAETPSRLSCWLLPPTSRNRPSVPSCLVGDGEGDSALDLRWEDHPPPPRAVPSQPSRSDASCRRGRVLFRYHRNPDSGADKCLARLQPAETLPAPPSRSHREIGTGPL